MFLLVRIVILSCVIILYIVGKKYFWRYCWQTFNTEKILNLQIKDRFKINVKQIIIMSKKVDYVKFKNRERK